MHLESSTSRTGPLSLRRLCFLLTLRRRSEMLSAYSVSHAAFKAFMRWKLACILHTCEATFTYMHNAFHRTLFSLTLPHCLSNQRSTNVSGALLPLKVMNGFQHLLTATSDHSSGSTITIRRLLANYSVSSSVLYSVYQADILRTVQNNSTMSS